MSATLTIARRELKASFDSAVAYIFICFSLLVLAGAFFYYEGGFWQANRASFESLFVWLPRGLSWVVIPVLTMRLVAEERRSGTLEMLITLPVKDHQIILGKFLGTWLVVLTLIASTLLYPLLMFKFWHLGTLDWGPVLAGYVGLVFYSAAAVSLGLLVSSLTENQNIAFFITFLLLLVLHVSGMFMGRVEQPSLQQVLAFISFDARLTPFTRGLVTTRDLLYFASIAVMALMASFRALERRKWS